jgi:hypothetical protein
MTDKRRKRSLTSTGSSWRHQQSAGKYSVYTNSIMLVK